VDEIRELKPDAIVLSPGPCTPAEAGICEEVIRQLGPTMPMLGVCLGHQAIATALGGSLQRAEEPVHGLTSEIEHDGSSLYENLPNPLKVTRYHSLVVEKSNLPSELIVTSKTADGIVMSLQHQSWPMFGVQFHPESVLTESGHDLLANFLKISQIETKATQRREAFPTQCQTEEDWEIFPNMRPVSW